nr:hypothetical protein [Tanacetum cinerariifolium]
MMDNEISRQGRNEDLEADLNERNDELQITLKTDFGVMGRLLPGDFCKDVIKEFVFDPHMWFLMSCPLSISLWCFREGMEELMLEEVNVDSLKTFEPIRVAKVLNFEVLIVGYEHVVMNWCYSWNQVALDEALIPSAQRLRIGPSNFCLPSDIQSKEPTLQVVYDVLRRSPFFRAFLVTADSFGPIFAELPFKEEILEFLRFLGHSAQIKTLTDVNVNKLYQPWRSFAAVINKCLTGKSTGFDSLSEMYYPRFTKVIIHYFMMKKPSIPRRNRVNWHYVRDDILFSTIKVVSRHHNTQQYGAILPIELTTKDIRNTAAYMEYYACATREAAPKPKASARKKKGGSAASTTPPTPIATPTPTTTVVAALRLSTAAKGKQPARARSPTEPLDVEQTEAEQLKVVLRRSRHEMHISQQGGSGTDEGTGSKPGVPDVPSDDSEEELSWNSSDDEDVDTQTQGRDESEVPNIDEQETTESDEGNDEATESDRESEDVETKEQEEESFDPIPRTPKESEDDDNNEEDQGLRIGEEKRMHEEEEADELYRDVDINQGRGLQVSQETEDSHVILTPTKSDAQQESSSTSSFMTNLLNPLIDPGMESIFTTGSTTVTPIHSPQSIMTPSIISTFTTASQLPTPPTQIPSLDLQRLPNFASVFHFEDRVKLLEVNFSNLLDRLQDSIQRENDEFLKTIDDNMKKIIKEQVKTQVKAQVTRILPRIKEFVNAQLEVEVLTRSSHSSRTSYAVAADLSEMELKKILIDKMEGNKREDDDQEGPSTGSDRGSKRRREGGEHASAITPSEPATGSAGRSTTGTHSQQLSANFFNFIMNRLGIDTLTPDLLASPTYELMRGSCNSLTELEYHLEEVYKATTNQLDWVNPEGQQYPHNLLQPLPLIPDNWGRHEPINYDKHAFWGVSHWGRKRQQFYGFAVNQESAFDVYSKRRIIAVTELKILEWHNYKHLDWISIRRDDDKIYKFKEGDFKRLCLQEIEDMLLLLVQGKLSKLIVEERFAFNVSLKMFTRSIVIQRRVEDIQLRVESYQKRLNLTNPNTYRSDLKRREAYTAYSNPRGFIYQNKDKKNRLIRIDELYKFSDGTLNDVRSALDDRLKGIRMQYLPTTIWKKWDKDRAAAMIQAIDKMLKTQRIMRSLERFVGGRQYEGDFRLLQRTI